MGGINLIKSLIIQLEDFHFKKHLSCWTAQIAARGGSCRSRDSAYKLIKEFLIMSFVLAIIWRGTNTP